MRPYENDDLKHMMAYKKRLDALKDAVDTRVALFERILNAGQPPHMDYWHQPIDAANKKIKEAYENLMGS